MEFPLPWRPTRSPSAPSVVKGRSTAKRRAKVGSSRKRARFVAEGSPREPASVRRLRCLAANAPAIIGASGRCSAEFRSDYAKEPQGSLVSVTESGGVNRILHTRERRSVLDHVLDFLSGSAEGQCRGLDHARAPCWSPRLPLGRQPLVPIANNQRSSAYRPSLATRNPAVSGQIRSRSLRTSNPRRHDLQDGREPARALLCLSVAVAAGCLAAGSARAGGGSAGARATGAHGQSSLHAGLAVAGNRAEERVGAWLQRRRKHLCGAGERRRRAHNGAAAGLDGQVMRSRG